MAHHCGSEEKLQFQDRNQQENPAADYETEGFEDRVHKSQAESYDQSGGEPKNVSYTQTQGLSGGNDPSQQEGGYGSAEKGYNEVDGSHEKKGFVEKIKEKLQGKPKGVAESKYEGEERHESKYEGEERHDQEREEYHEEAEKDGEKKGILEKIKEKISPSP